MIELSNIVNNILNIPLLNIRKNSNLLPYRLLFLPYKNNMYTFCGISRILFIAYTLLRSSTSTALYTVEKEPEPIYSISKKLRTFIIALFGLLGLRLGLG